MAAPDADAVRARFAAACGYWPHLLDAVVELDPALADAYCALVEVAWRDSHLEPRLKELIGVAVTAATTHLYEPALREHIRAALAFGATRAEIVEVLELTSVLGMHTATMGLPALADELGPAGAPPLTDRHTAVRERFRDGRGMWPGFLEDVLRQDVELLDAYLDFSLVPWRTGVLGPKFRELVYIAIDASTTHLYETGTRMHIQNALRAGATREEIREVLRLIVPLGIHAYTMAAPVLAEELGRAATEQAS